MSPILTPTLTTSQLHAAMGWADGAKSCVQGKGPGATHHPSSPVRRKEVTGKRAGKPSTRPNVHSAFPSTGVSLSP